MSAHWSRIHVDAGVRFIPSAYGADDPTWLAGSLAALEAEMAPLCATLLEVLPA